MFRGAANEGPGTRPRGPHVTDKNYCTCPGDNEVIGGLVGLCSGYKHKTKLQALIGGASVT